MKGLGHFPMSEDPQAFLTHLLPVLDKIAAELNSRGGRYLPGSVAVSLSLRDACTLAMVALQ